ncbi:MULTISPECIES: AAA family ATPase [unclassified Sutcliffiella]|jgi:predicted kinase|uniref:AAA family ATPase n=1 Tax=unclassified Sutcliffiella TaxID=2837532 RepID=UPI0030CABBA1
MGKIQIMEHGIGTSKRLLIMTVGKTHSGKTTFAKKLEQALQNSMVMDQDNHAEFINTHYQKLQPTAGPNTLKHAVSELIVRYAINQTDLHLIISNANRNLKSRKDLLAKFFPEDEFYRILVHFDIPDEVLKERVENSMRSTNIFRGASNFKEVLNRQQKESLLEDVTDPEEGEGNRLFIIRDNREEEEVIQEILEIVKGK